MTDKINFSKTGVLLLSHGSRLPQSEEVISSFLKMFKEEYPDCPVEYCFMELREPNIPQAIDKLTKKHDLERIIAIPVFVSHGLHTKRDIPKILGIESDFNEEKNSHHGHHHGHDHGHHHHHHHEIQEVNFDGEIILTDPLGADPLIFEIIKKRLIENL